LKTELRLVTAPKAIWRDKRGHEIDFVLAGRRKNPAAVECKWSAGKFEPRNLEAFRRQHSEGENVVLAEDVKQPFTRNYGTLKCVFEGLESFVSQLAE
jgi:uncharacterized protein